VSTLAQFGLVFLAGLATDLATGLGALPFFFTDDVSDRWQVGLWGLASGIMVSASGFGLVREALSYGGPVAVAAGALVGVAMVEVADRIISDHHFEPRRIAEADFKKLVLVVGVLTVHSFPEGVAVGVSFAEIDLVGAETVPLLGFGVPLLAVFMTVAISIHNVPEGLAVSIPLSNHGLSGWRMVGVAVFTSVPQPIGAVVAFGFVQIAQQFLPAGFGFAAGAMVYLVATEFLPEARETGADLPRGGLPETVAGFAAGAVLMVPLLFA
jgi:ZIP family zinc transporter